MPHWMLLRSVVLPPSLGILVKQAAADGTYGTRYWWNQGLALIQGQIYNPGKGKHQIWALKWWDRAMIQCELDLPRRNPDAVSCAEHAVTVRCPILRWQWQAGVQYFNRKVENWTTRVLTLFKFQFLIYFLNLILSYGCFRLLTSFSTFFNA